MKKAMLFSVFLAIIVFVVSAPNPSGEAFAQGQRPIVFTGTFELSQAVPPPAVSPPSVINGAIVAYFNPEDNELIFQVALTNLTSSARAVQFHNAPAGDFGPPVQTICGEGPAGVIGTSLAEGPCRPGTNHVMQQTWTMTDDQVSELLAGNIYVNVHTEDNFTPGEIRAQLTQL